MVFFAGISIGGGSIIRNGFLLVSDSTQSSVVSFFSSETSLKKDPQGEDEKDRISIMKETQRQKKVTEATQKNEHLTITTNEKERFDHSSWLFGALHVYSE